MKKKDKDELKFPMFPYLGMPIDPFRSIIEDPMGSNNVLPIDILETPEQDADDL